MFIGNKNSLWSASKGTTLKDGLLMCLELDEISGATAFDSHSNNDFINTNAVIDQAGIIDKSYYFGGNAYLKNQTLGGLFSQTNVISISVWFKTFDAVPTQVIFEYSDSYYNKNAFIILFGSNSFKATQHSPLGTNSTFGNTLLSGDIYDGNFHNAIVIFDRNQVGAGQTTLYLDGLLQTQYSSITTLTGNFDNYLNSEIGARVDGNIPLTANLDQLPIWNRVLTQEERELIYNNGVGLPYTQW